MRKAFFPFFYFLLLVGGIASLAYPGSFRQDNQHWDIRVFKTDKKNIADLVVYEVPNFAEAQGNDAFWKWSPVGATAVSFTPWIEAADLVIYVTHNKKETGWQRNHPLRSQLQS